jgi:membrane protein implicated in regulation of membrane protease activity
MNWDFGLFWEGLTTLGKIYWIIAIPSTAIFLIVFLLSLIGADKDLDTSIHIDGDLSNDMLPGEIPSHIGFGDYFLSFKTVMSFLTMFAWIGIAGLAAHLLPIITIIISFIAGLIMMTGVSALLYYITKLQYSGTMDLKNAIGQTGDVYITIPANKTAIGKVQVIVQGSLRTLDAVTEEDEPIKQNTNIEVINVLEDNILLVKRIEE